MLQSLLSYIFSIAFSNAAKNVMHNTNTKSRYDTENSHTYRRQ